MRKRGVRKGDRNWLRWGQWIALAGLAALVTVAVRWPSPAAAADPVWWNCDWGYRRKLTFNNSGQAENLLNFPVLVVLDGSRINYSQTKTGGEDLRFVDPDGTVLAYEIEQWNPTGVSYIWVNVPKIDASSVTDHIWMYYGNPSAGSGQNPTNVWTNGYVGVWHLNEDPSGSAPQMKDSTANNNDGTSQGSMTSGQQVAGQIGGSLNFDGNNDVIRVPDTPTTSIEGNQFTLSAWVRPTDISGDGDSGIISKAHESSSNVERYHLGIDRAGKVNVRRYSGSLARLDTNTGDVVNNQWQYLVGRYDGSTLKAYVNGVEVGSMSASGNIDPSDKDLIFGKRYDSRYYTGQIDEIRFANVARSANWIKAQHLSMIDAFIAYGSQETQDCPPPQPFAPCDWNYRKKITIDSTKVPSELTNLPVLISLTDAGLAANARADGNDIVFTASDEITKLSHQIEKFDGATGELVAWVKVPTLSSSQDTVLYMYYGNAATGSQQNAEDVWSNGFVGVWHLHNLSDSSGNENHGTASGSVTQADGKIGKAQQFGGSSGNQINVAHSSELDGMARTTFSFWVKPDSSQPVTFPRLIEKGDLDPYVIELVRADKALRPKMDPASAGPDSPANSIVFESWQLIHWVYDGSEYRIYINAQGPYSVRARTGSVNTDPNTQLTFGNRAAGDRQFNGLLEEMRIAAMARSAAWIETEYNNQNSPSTFYSVGEQESAPTVISYFAPDAAAAGMHVPVTFVGSVCAVPAVTTSSPDVIVGPSIVTDKTGAVVAWKGHVLNTMFFVKPGAAPATGITVSLDGTPLDQTFDIVIPSADPNVPASGSGAVGGRTKRGTAVLGGLTVGTGGNLTIDTSDTDGSTAGNQGYLPAVILVKGDVNIAGTLEVSGKPGVTGGANCTGGDGGAGGPGGGGGGGGGVKEVDCVGAMFTRVQAANAIGNPTASATFGDTPMQGNLLVAISFHRKDVTSASISGSGWTQRVFRSTLLSNSDFRRGLAIWTKVAGASEPTNIQTSWSGGGSDKTNRLIIQEFSAGIEGAVWTFEGKADNDNGSTSNATSLGTGTTGSIPAGDLFLVTALGIRNASGVNITSSSWTNGVGDNIHINGGGNGKTVATGFGHHTAGGTKSSTASWSGGNSGASAAILVFRIEAPGGGATGAPGGAGRSGGGGGGSKGSGTGGAGGAGTAAAGSAASGTTGGAGGAAMGGAAGGGGAPTDPGYGGGNGGGGGTGNPFGSGGQGAPGGGGNDGGAGGEGGGGGGAMGNAPGGGGGGGGFATAGQDAEDGDDFGKGGLVNGKAQLVPLSGGSGGGGGGGGGAVLIYATGSINITGTITAAGGKGGNGYVEGSEGSGGGGGGSGGAIFLQSGEVTVSSTLTTAGGAKGTSTGTAAGGTGGTGRIRIDGLGSGATVPGTAGSKYIGPVIDTLEGTTVTGRGDGASDITLYVYDGNGNQVNGSPYSAFASGSPGTVGTWSVSSVTFPMGIGYLAVKQQTSGGVEVFGPGRATRGVRLIYWREVY